MVGGGTVTFVSSPPPLDNLLSRWVSGFPVGLPLFVTFIKKFLQKRGVFGTVNSVWHICGRLLPSFRPRGLKGSSFLDKDIAFQ